jgi:hypothetical protein
MGRKRIDITERKLGRERALGLINDETEAIEIDPRQTPREWLSTLVHEAVHAAFPELKTKEAKVLKAERKITSILWKAGVRRVHQ